LAGYASLTQADAHAGFNGFATIPPHFNPATLTRQLPPRAVHCTLPKRLLPSSMRSDISKAARSARENFSSTKVDFAGWLAWNCLIVIKEAESARQMAV
jgi:hypothetical protein